ncbi:flagellar basal body rod protein [Bacillus sp. AFS076308]|uniref:lmo0954 family membrane protein n=1 Tax=Bacillus sp. AFS076308 TaxID=2033512 RepID=UPI000BF91E06|nr:flagellar basal body rod protein [Bacillus sp. AFS076308]PFN98507.1 flagellar basal body rod protein [Bacillus sp. AFS076308]
MKKFGLLLAGGLAALILLHSIGPMVGLLVSLVLLYFIFRQFLKTDSIAWKIGLVIIGLIVLSSTIHHIPALIGVAAAYVLYLVYKEWNKSKKAPKRNGNDPFVNFEKQWNEFKK